MAYWFVAVFFLAPLCAQSPATGFAWFAQGLAQHTSGAYDDAIHSFQSALDLRFNQPGASMRIGRAYAKKKDIDKAIEWMDKAAQAGFSAPGLILADPDTAAVRSDKRFGPILARMNINARPCEANSAYRTFDFWIGEWDVTSAGNPTNKSESSIQKLVEGCAILENWYGGGKQAGPGTTGKSLNYFNPATGKWRQLWVSDTCVLGDYQGEFRDGAMRFERDFVQGAINTKGRMTFTPLEPGKVRQFIEQSTDGGKTWVTQFDGLYVRKK